MTTILVATDYSAPAANAVDFAAQLAKKTGAELVLFNVYKLSIHASNSLASTGNIDHLIKKSEAKLAELAASTEVKYGIDVKWTQGKDDTIESLKNYTSINIVDLVVMGIESNLIEYKMFGNTTTDAIKLMQFPLLVVPNDVLFKDFENIMYACEASYLKDNCELGFLKRFVKAFDAHLDVFHVLTDDQNRKSNYELEQLMDRILSDVDHDFKYVNNPKVGDGIKQGLSDYPSDLLVMIPHKLGFFESIFKGSNTSQMTVNTRVPLLVIPNDKAC